MPAEPVLCLNNGFAMLDLHQNVLDYFGSYERLGVLVRDSNELVDHRDQFRHALEDAAENPLARYPDASQATFSPRDGWVSQSMVRGNFRNSSRR